jgi:thiamine kinase-like enzyme
MRAVQQVSTSKELGVMLRRQGKSNVPQADVMSRQETAVWLGRALSTNEVTLRVVLELLDVVAFQQAVIKQFYEQDHVVSVNHNDQASEPEMSEVSQKIVEKLTQLREELDPVLKTVEDACQQFEKMIQPVSKQAKHS